jgi:hypothetical protein
MANRLKHDEKCPIFKIEEWEIENVEYYYYWVQIVKLTNVISNEDYLISRDTFKSLLSSLCAVHDDGRYRPSGI